MVRTALLAAALLVSVGNATADPTGGRIVESAFDRNTGAEVWRLSNGARVIYKRLGSKTSNDYPNRVVLAGWSDGGLAAVTEDEEFPVGLCKDIVRAASGADLSSGMSVSVSVNRYSHSVLGIVSPDDETALEEMFRRFGWCFTDSLVISREVFDNLMDWHGYLSKTYDSPVEKVRRAWRDSLNLFVFGSLSQEKEVTPAMLQNTDYEQIALLYPEIYARLFGNAANFTFILAGDVEEAAARRLVKCYLASLPSDGPLFARAESERVPLRGCAECRFVAPELIDRRDRAVACCIWSGEMPRTFENRTAIRFLGNILRQRYDRQKIYSYPEMSVSAEAGRFYAVQVNVEADALRIDSVKQMAVDFMRSIAADGLSDGERDMLDSLKREDIESHNNFELVNSLRVVAILSRYYWADFDDIIDHDRRVNGITPATIVDMARKIVADDNFRSIVMVSPPAL